MIEPALKHLLSLTQLPVGVYANTGSPSEKETGKLNPTVNPDQYLIYTKKWKSMGARIIGGCCGTNPMYIMKLAGLK
jgi:S-methylmethionine-dependent homocysteine/selenocysteine methylase